MARYPAPPRTPWRDDFPQVTAQAEYRTMRDHPAYRDAKDGIDSNAALLLVFDLINDQSVEAIAQQIAGRDARIVSVHAEEATGRNRIPLAYAEVLASVLDLTTDAGIVQSSVANHGNAPSIYHRMVSQPSFDGYVESDVNYVIVDDNCTAGGTLANLKGYIETNGGRVICASVLARRSFTNPCYLSLDPVTLRRLNREHGTLDTFWMEEFGNGLDTLTEGEAGHLFAAPSTVTIRNRLAEARRDLGILRNENLDRGATPAADEGDD